MVRNDSFNRLYIAIEEYLLEYKKNTLLSKIEADNRLRMLEIINKSQLRLSKDAYKRIYWEKEFNDKFDSCLYAISTFKNIPLQTVKQEILQKAGIKLPCEIENQEFRNSSRISKKIFPMFAFLGILVILFSSILDKIDTLNLEKDFVLNKELITK